MVVLSFIQYQENRPWRKISPGKIGRPGKSAAQENRPPRKIGRPGKSTAQENRPARIIAPGIIAPGGKSISPEKSFIFVNLRHCDAYLENNVVWVQENYVTEIFY